MGLRLENVDKLVGREVHLKDIDLRLKPGSRHVVLGRTLAGKTSLLRILAGLDKPTKGRVIAGGNDVTGMSVRKRSVAMVYQQFINYPSQTVYDNIASPLKIQGFKRDDIDQRVRQAASMLHIEHLMDRLPAELSGGQQQRTAIARALVKDVDLLLLDEPLVNLDYKLREELRDELRQIFSARESVVVYTTTEPSEALMLGGEVIVMHEGRILQTGPTAEVYLNPVNTTVAQVFSDPPINFISGRVTADGVVLGEGLNMPKTPAIDPLAQGDYTFGVRSNKLSLSREGSQKAAIEAVVELSEINGSETFLHVSHGGSTLVVQQEGVHSHRAGSTVKVRTRLEDFYVFDAAGELIVSPDRDRS